MTELELNLVHYMAEKTVLQMAALSDKSLVAMMVAVLVDQKAALVY